MHFSFEESETLDRQVSPCKNDGTDEARRMRDRIVDTFLNGAEGEMLECQNDDATIPCMIPHAQDLLTPDEQKSLGQCSTWLQYNCMLTRLMYEYRVTIQVVTNLQLT